MQRFHQKDLQTRRRGKVEEEEKRMEYGENGKMVFFILMIGQSLARWKMPSTGGKMEVTQGDGKTMESSVTREREKQK